MGSRRRRYPALVLLALAGACTSGAPPGFAGGRGDTWTFPLIGPLEDGLLLTPVVIDGHGPYVFAIDPDANDSVIDEQIVKEAQLRPRQGPHRLDESDTQQIRFYAEINAVEIGSLIIERRDVMVVKTGTFDREGRRIHGVLGRDFLPDSLVFGFDRDQGLGTLLTVKAFKAPADALKVTYDLLPSHVPNAEVLPVPRRIAIAKIGGESFPVHLDLGATLSTLREAAWDKAKLVALPVKTGSIDEVGMPHRIERVGTGQPVALGTVTADHMGFAPFEDQRWSDSEIAGTLALDFFRAFDVWLDWNAKAIYLVKRVPVPLATRIGRWETGALGKCPHEGCVQVRVIDPMAGKTLAPGAVHPGVVISVTRDEVAGGMDLEVVLEPKNHPELPRLVVSMNANGERVLEHLKGEWANVELAIVDASPFPRLCPGATGCVDLIAR